MDYGYYSAFSMLGGLMIGILIFSIVFYVLSSLCLVNMFKAYKFDKTWYAWIPFLNTYTLADLTCGEYFELGSFKLEHKIFVWYFIIAFIVAWVPVIGTIASLVVSVIGAGYCYKNALGKMKLADKNSGLGYLCAIIPVILYFIVLPWKPETIEEGSTKEVQGE